MNQNRANTLFLFGILILSISHTYGQKKPIVIREQGSFSVGGSVITNPGSFDPIKRTPEGQTFHGDHAYVFYQIPVKAKKLLLFSGMASGNFQKHGRQLLTDVKVFRIFF